MIMVRMKASHPSNPCNQGTFRRRAESTVSSTALFRTSCEGTPGNTSSLAAQPRVENSERRRIQETPVD